MKLPRALGGVLTSLACAACGARTPLRDDPAPRASTVCAGAAPVCVARPGDPCGAAVQVPPECDEAAAIWRCPAGAWRHARAPESTTVCLPFRDASGTVASLGGSLARVPMEDGRCLWIAEDVALAGGARMRNVAMELDPRAPFGGCPPVHFAGGYATGAVVVDGSTDPELSVQITGGVRVGNVTRVAYRLFQADATAGFGVRELGTGLGRWDPTMQRIVVSSTPTWDPTLDLGDAAWSDGDTAYVWGCPGVPAMLAERCVLSRVDAAGAMELYAGAGRWVASVRAADAVAAFEAGPWVSSVFRSAAGFAHVYALGFATSLGRHTAPSVEGPWTADARLADCDLPRDDAHAFCAGPVVHTERIDPLRPQEFPVTYGVGTVASDGAARAAANPAAYWSRLHLVAAP